MIYLVGSNLEFEGVKTLVLNEIKFNKFSVNLAEFDALVLTSKNSVNALKFNQILTDSFGQNLSLNFNSTNSQILKYFKFRANFT